MTANNTDQYIYLLSDKAELEQAKLKGSLVRDSLVEEGFIHATPRNQLNRLANKYYKERINPLILVVDQDKITAEVKWEPATGGLYPHIYGELNADAIVNFEPIALAENGTFQIS
jgi:uncharacterized protein (DUF952 family)